jgi:selenocysteine lyase/cysteine desulfurase
MRKSKPGLSRRQFIGSSTVALGGLNLAGFAGRSEAQQAVPALPLEKLRPSGTPDEAYWWKVRSQFNLIDGYTFMNNGTLGPMPKMVMDEHDRVFAELAADPTNGSRREELHANRPLLAGFVGSDPEETAYTRSTTEGMNIFAMGVDWREGDEILMCTHEHNGGIEAYLTLEKRRGVKIKWLEVPSPPESIDQIIELYDQAITPRTRCIMVSHLTYVTGLLMPVKELTELARRRGLLISVDGAHPLGMIDIDFHAMGCDHYAASGQKWLMCGTGTGLVCVSRNVMDRVWPLMGAGSYRDKDTEELKFYRDSRKYEDAGQRHAPSALGMPAAIRFQNTIGKKQIENRVRQLSTRLKEGLKAIKGVKVWTSMDPTLSAGLTLFSIRDIPMENVKQALMERDRIYIRTMSRGDLNGVRVSTHIYNMPGEVDRLLAGARHLAKNWSDYMAAPTV